MLALLKKNILVEIIVTVHFKSNHAAILGGWPFLKKYLIAPIISVIFG